ncbi:MAG: hypothetical protein ACREQA_23920, partial [Candidatus Binatia bacterium]
PQIADRGANRPDHGGGALPNHEWVIRKNSDAILKRKKTSTPSVVRHKKIYTPFVVSPSPPFVLSASKERTVLRTGLSNHAEKILKTFTLRLAQGERNM